MTLIGKGIFFQKYRINAVHFDTDDRCEKSSGTGWSDSKSITASFWIQHVENDEGHVFDLYDSGDGSQFRIKQNALPNNDIQLRYFDGSSTRFFATSETSLTGGWDHVYISFDLNNTSNRVIAINGSVTTPIWSTYDNVTMDLVVGAYAQNFGGNGVTGNNQRAAYDIAELWIDTGYNSSSNISKFRDPSTGKPVDLGIDGSTPFASQPIEYFSVRPGDAATVWLTNKGSGANWTMNNGTLSTASTSPSD